MDRIRDGSATFSIENKQKEIEKVLRPFFYRHERSKSSAVFAGQLRVIPTISRLTGGVFVIPILTDVQWQRPNCHNQIKKQIDRKKC